METSIAELRANKQNPNQQMQAPQPPQMQMQAPQPPQQIHQQPLPQPTQAPQPMQHQLQQMQQPAQWSQQTGNIQYPMDMSLHYNKIKDIGVLLLLCMIMFSTPFQDILVKNLPFLTSTNTGKHTNMMGCLMIASMVSSSFTVYKTFGIE